MYPPKPCCGRERGSGAVPGAESASDRSAPGSVGGSDPDGLAYHDDAQAQLGYVLRGGNLNLDLGTGRNHRLRQNEESTGREIHHDSLVTLSALHDLAEETPLDPLQSP
jgi:hypothetical protein